MKKDDPQGSRGNDISDNAIRMGRVLDRLQNGSYCIRLVKLNQDTWSVTIDKATSEYNNIFSKES